MSGREPKPGASWRAEIRGIRNTARSLAAPPAGFTGLLSPGEDLLGLLADSPEDLPLVAFSPFAGLPGGGAVPARARRTEGPVPKGGRAPGVPPAPSRGEAPAAVRPAATPPARSRPAISPETGPDQPAQTVPPVFSFRRQDGKAGPVPSSPPARGTMQGAGPGTPAAKRALSLSDLLSLKSGETWPEPQRMVENVSRSMDPAGELPAARSLPDPAGLSSAGTGPADAIGPVPRDRPAPAEGAAPFEIPPAEGTGRPLELLNDLADRALRRQDRTVPAPVPDRIDVPTLESSTSLARTAALAMDSEVKARLLGLETGTPDAEPAPGLPASGGPALLDAETLADLVNEALVEQARRHGVDLS